MIKNSYSPPLAAAEDAGADSASTIRIVAVGEPAEWQSQGNALPSQGLKFIAFDDVTSELFNRLPLVTVFSPILGKRFDCIDLAMQLNKIGFGGAYRAIAGDLPMPTMIEHEVRQLCPQLDFRIVECC